MRTLPKGAIRAKKPSTSALSPALTHGGAS
jgi:hypothetical protein